jgi:hypothetical protein
MRRHVGLQYAHWCHKEYFWENYIDDKEARMQHYMQMTTFFVKAIKIFTIPDQVIKDDNVIDKIYDAFFCLTTTNHRLD